MRKQEYLLIDDPCDDFEMSEDQAKKAVEWIKEEFPKRFSNKSVKPIVVHGKAYDGDNMVEQNEPTNEELLQEIRQTKVELATALSSIAENISQINGLLTKVLTGAALQVSTEAVEEKPEPNRYGR